MRNALLVLTALLLSAPAFAQRYDKSGEWEFAVAAPWQEGTNDNGTAGSTVKVDNTWGFSFYLGYNFNNRFRLGADFDFLRPDFDATIVNEENPGETIRIQHTASQFNGRLKGTLNLLDGPFVPFVEAGIGWTHLDSNVANGPPVSGCWWHPWWGLICQNFFRTYNSTEFSYGAGVGLRYELRGNSQITLSYNYWELDTGDNRASPSLQAARLEYGWRF